ncbi:MAG: ribosome hibernation-promoting factor, HPF/YfiA family [Bacilli bacterium]
MHYIIRGENVEVTPAIREYVEKKLSRLERHFDSAFEVKVNLKVYSDRQKVEVTVQLPHHITLRAEEAQTDLYAAVDIVADKLERQIRKHKTRLNRKLRDKGHMSAVFAPETTTAVLDIDEDDTIVRTKSFELKPMDVEEAILQMNMLGHTFYVFTNADSNETNVVYVRNDGKYGLIETR